MAEADSTGLKIIPAPTGGWNARDPLHSMPENDAVELINFFPDSAQIVNRGGSTVFASQGSADQAKYHVTTLIPFHKLGGTKSLIGVAVLAEVAPGSQNISIYDFTAGTFSSLLSCGGPVLTYDLPWAWVQFKDRIFMANASGYGPYDVSNTLVVTATAWTGSGLTKSLLWNVSTYKGRLYWVEQYSGKIWYGGLEMATGALVAYDASGQLHKGGYILACGSTSRQSGNLSENLFCIISSEGELLLFSGDYPGANNWTIVGRYFTAKPMGRRCLFYQGADLHVITADGIIPFNSLMSGAEGLYQTTTDKIQNAYRTEANAFLANAYNFNVSFEALAVPTQKSVIVNIPTPVNCVGNPTDTTSKQFVQNSITGAWCEYSGLNAISMCVYGDDVYYGTTNGQILKLEKPGTDKNLDNTTPIPYSCKLAYNYLDDPTREKHLISTKMFFNLTASGGAGSRVIQVGADSDFISQGVVNNIVDILIPDWVATSTSYITQCTILAEGNTFALLIRAQFGGGWVFAWNLAIVNYESGGFLQ